MATTLSRDEVITAGRFKVIAINKKHIHMEKKLRKQSITGYMVAVLGQTLTNVDKVYIGDTARVTMALMPDMKTLYCVQASITKRVQYDDPVTVEAHPAVHQIDNLTQPLIEQVLASGGRDVNGNYVGIGRLVDDQMTARFGPPVNGHYTTNVAKKNKRVASVDYMQPAKRMKACMYDDTDSSAMEKPQVAALPVATVYQQDVLETIVTENPIIKTDKSESKSMGRREIVSRVKKSLFSCPEMMQLLAKSDPEVLTAILRR